MRIGLEKEERNEDITCKPKIQLTRERKIIISMLVPYSSGEPLRVPIAILGKEQTASLFPPLREEGPNIALPH